MGLFWHKTLYEEPMNGIAGDHRNKRHGEAIEISEDSIKWFEKKSSQVWHIECVKKYNYVAFSCECMMITPCVWDIHTCLAQIIMKQKPPRSLITDVSFWHIRLHETISVCWRAKVWEQIARKQKGHGVWLAKKTKNAPVKNIIATKHWLWIWSNYSDLTRPHPKR